MRTIRLGILGTGNMAKGHARGFAAMKGVRLVSCCDLVRERAEAFAAEFGIGEAYDDPRRMLAAGNLDAVTNVTIDGAHCATTLLALRHGLHVLCEKPLATNGADAWRMVRAARRAGVVNMVNFSYRASAALAHAARLVAAGRLGELRHVEASYLQGWLSTMSLKGRFDSPGAAWRLCSATGSRGDLGDIGVHIVDFATAVAGPVRRVSCRLATYPKGTGDNTVNGLPMDANDSFGAVLEFANGALGVVHSTRWATGHPNSLRLRVFGTRGALVVDLDRSWGDLEVCLGPAALRKAAWRTVHAPKIPGLYQRFIRAIRTGRPGTPDFAVGAQVQDVLDACFRADAAGQPAEIRKR